MAEFDGDDSGFAYIVRVNVDVMEIINSELWYCNNILATLACFLAAHCTFIKYTQSEFIPLEIDDHNENEMSNWMVLVLHFSIQR